MAKDKSGAQRPFPIFLLPSLKIPLRARRPIDFSLTKSKSKTKTKPATTASTTKPTPAIPTPTALRLTRTNPDTLRCSTCATDVALASQIISKGFTGRHGRAYLVGPAPDDGTSATSPGPAPSSYSTPDLINVVVGRCESRQLVTGWHTVADIACLVCHAKLGWKYVDAKEATQRYKVGKFILETERVVTYRSWEDTPRSSGSGGGSGGADSEEEEIEFDSDDEDECDDIFSGTWDRESVARRRSRRVGYRS